MNWRALPGGELVADGLADLSAGRDTIEAALVSVGASRLSTLGLAPSRTIAEPEHRLYELLAADESDTAHSRYVALVRRLVSFERALASQRW